MKAFTKQVFDHIYTSKSSKRRYAVTTPARGTSDDGHDDETRLIPLGLVPVDLQQAGASLAVIYRYIDYRDRQGIPHCYMIPVEVRADGLKQ